MAGPHRAGVDAPIPVRDQPGEATWAPGAPVTGWLDGAPALRGEVLFSQCPHRLSYVLAAGPEDPEVYVTWEVERCATGSIVRLSIDECGHSDAAQVKESWLPVVSALRGLLVGGGQAAGGDVGLPAD